VVVQPPLRELDHKRALRMGVHVQAAQAVVHAQAGGVHAKAGIDSSITITTIMPEQGNHNAMATGSAFLKY
jgi:hypothetical protein